MGRCPPSFEYSGDTQDERTRANRGHVFRSTRLSADDLNGFAIADRLDDPVAAGGDTEQVEGGQFAKVCVGTRPRPQSLGTGASDFATMWVADWGRREST